jgi:hypothetical protein
LVLEYKVPPEGTSVTSCVASLFRKSYFSISIPTDRSLVKSKSLCPAHIMHSGAHLLHDLRKNLFHFMGGFSMLCSIFEQLVFRPTTGDIVTIYPDVPAPNP